MYPNTRGLAICLYTGSGRLCELNGTCAGPGGCTLQSDGGNTAIPASPSDPG
jgi:hypothetical protein